MLRSKKVDSQKNLLTEEMKIEREWLSRHCPIQIGQDPKDPSYTERAIAFNKACDEVGVPALKMITRRYDSLQDALNSI